MLNCRFGRLFAFAPAESAREDRRLIKQELQSADRWPPAGSESDDWPENRNWSDRNEGVGLLFARVAPRLAVVAVLLSAPSPLTDRTKLRTGRGNNAVSLFIHILRENAHASHIRMIDPPRSRSSARRHTVRSCFQATRFLRKRFLFFSRRLAF